MDIRAIRTQIPALRDGRPLNAGGIAPMPQATRDALAACYAREGREGGSSARLRAWYDEEYEGLRRDLARFLNAAPDEIALIRAVSECISLVAEGLDLRRGDRVILTDEEHPSGYLSWLNLWRRRGIDVAWAQVVGDDGAFMAGLEAATNDRTRAICLSHVTTERGFVLPVREVSAFARERGIVTVIDGAQSAGQIPVDFHDLGCDFYTFPAFKWCMGPYGVGAMYVRAGALELVDVAGSGLGAVETSSFPPGDLALHRSAQRYEYGARPYPLYAAWRKSLEFLKAAGGMPAVHARNRQLALDLVETLHDVDGAEIHTPDQGLRRTGILTFGLRDVAGSSLAEHLIQAHRIQCRSAHHGRGVRISLHFFADRTDVDAVVGAARAYAAR